MGECRMTRFGFFNQEDFNRVSCANCYRLLKYVFFDSKSEFNTHEAGYIITSNHTFLDPTVNDHIEEIKNQINPLESVKWRECCDAAKKCCNNMISLSQTILPIDRQECKF
jgi:hypothetical protein